jgi:hypothetical protein
MRGATIWHHGVTERQETVAFGQRKSFLRDLIVSPAQRTIELSNRVPRIKIPVDVCRNSLKY